MIKLTVLPMIGLNKLFGQEREAEVQRLERISYVDYVKIIKLGVNKFPLNNSVAKAPPNKNNEMLFRCSGRASPHFGFFSG